MKVRTAIKNTGAAIMLLLGISCSDDFKSPQTSTGPTIFKVVSTSDNFNILTAAFEKTGLDEMLSNSNSGAVTLFAPTDDAFLTFLQSSSAFNVTLTEEEAITKINALTNTTPSSSWNLLSLVSRLDYHVVSSLIKSSQITGPLTLTTLSTPTSTSGQARLSLSLVGSDILINANSSANGAKVTAVDAAASNGIIHTIDRVLAPSSTSTVLSLIGITGINYTTVPVVLTPTLSTLEKSNDTSAPNGNDYDILAYALAKTGLYSLLQPNVSPIPDLTIFAPSDDAFRAYYGDVSAASKAGEDAVLATIKGLSSTDLDNLASILKYHIVSGRVMTSDLSNDAIVTTSLTGKTFKFLISSDVTPVLSLDDNNAATNPVIKSANVISNAGVLHRIDAVLQPE